MREGVGWRDLPPLLLLLFLSFHVCSRKRGRQLVSKMASEQRSRFQISSNKEAALLLCCRVSPLFDCTLHAASSR